PGFGDQAAQRLASTQAAGPGGGKCGVGTEGGHVETPEGVVRVELRCAVQSLRRRPRRFWLGLRTGLPASIASRRFSTPYCPSAFAKARTEAFGAMTSTRSPNSMAVFSVSGPITAIAVVLCGLPAIPTRFRTVEEEVNSTASKAPPLSPPGWAGAGARRERSGRP